jgi:hypothetical protein
MQLGYSSYAEVPASIYDTSAVLGWVVDRLKDDPVEFVLASLGNAIDLFGNAYWPDDYAELASRRVLLLKQAVFVFVLVPGLAFFGLQLLRIFRRRDIGDTTSLLVALLLGLFALSCASLGEARYRLPFDVVLIVFAARAFTRTLARTADEPSVVKPIAFTLATPALSLVCLLLVAVAHPQVQLASHLRSWISGASPKSFAVASLQELAIRRPPGTRWDAPGVHSYLCRDSACGELRVTLPARMNAPAWEISVDPNDRYRLTFYRGDEVASRTAIGIPEVSPPGLQPRRIAAPEGGYDAIGIWPLYGDGRYAIGHLVPLAR